MDQNAKQKAMNSLAFFNPTFNMANSVTANAANKRSFAEMANDDVELEPQQQQHRSKRQRYPNDGGLTDMEYMRIMEARKYETEQYVREYIDERKKQFPTEKNITSKLDVIAAKTKRGQILSINEQIQKYQNDTGNKKTPSVLRFLQTPRYDRNLVRKVLKTEIEQEHSAILQCFRFIIQSKYLTDLQFDDGDKSGT